MATQHHSKQVPFPTKEEILAFIGKNPGKIGTREIARAFDLKNDRRVELKRLFASLPTRVTSRPGERSCIMPARCQT